MSTDKELVCHECGSAITAAETFCPYCGISLAPVALDGDTVDESLESTIMISPGEAENLAKMAKAAPANETPTVEEPAPDQTPDNEEPSVSDLAEDVPVPSIISDLGRTHSDIPPPKTLEFASAELQFEPEPAIETIEDDPKSQIDAEAAVSETENELTAGPEVPATNEIEEANENGSDPEWDMSLDVTMRPGSASVEPIDDGTLSDAEASAEPEPVEEAATNEDDAVSAKAEEKTADEAFAQTNSQSDEKLELREEEEPQADEPAAEIAKPAEGIQMPVDDLSEYDSFRSPSMFDSVRIMDPTQSDRADDVDTRLQAGGLHVGAGTPGSDTGGYQSSQPQASDPMPSTSHNIGRVDTDGKKGSKLKPLSEGIVLNGRYEIIRKIGGGGMGAVYLASDNNLGGVLRAVKEMVQSHIEEEQQEKAINDFKRESMILSSLDHVSIPTIYDYFYDDVESRFYLVMKYISGGDLASRMRSAKEGRIEERTVCEWAVQICDVLDYLHNQPSTIVYRDLKPSNIMIDGNSGRAMLIDFGIARSIGKKEEKGVTAVGTMGYAPPELFSGNVEPRSDIYSLGSTMFHLLTGADPQSNPLLIFDFQKNPRPRQINPQLSDQIERLMMRAVQYNSEERFTSAAEMRDKLEDHLLKLKAGIVTFGVSEVPASVSLAQQSVFCGFCGQKIVATDMFCAFCGAKQPIAQHGVHSEIYGHAAWTAKLLVEGTSELNAPAFSLSKEENLLGRRDPMSNIFPEVDLSKYDPQTKISRRHARIWRDGTNFMVEDLGSSNGTVLSRSPNDTFRLTPKQPQVLSAGDRLRLGDATLHFIVG